MNKPSVELLKKCKKDDRKAHFELYSICFSMLISVCRRYYKNDEDIKTALNNVFLKLIKNIDFAIDKYNVVPFELWLRRVAINHIIDEYRKNKKYLFQNEFTDDYSLNDAEQIKIEDSMVSKENMEEIDKAIDSLPEMSRTVFNLFVKDGYKHEEIAEMLHISSNTSKVHLHKARLKLQQILKMTAAIIVIYTRI